MVQRAGWARGHGPGRRGGEVPGSAAGLGRRAGQGRGSAAGLTGGRSSLAPAAGR